MQEMEALYKSWQGLLAANTANNDEFEWTTNQINSKLVTVEPDLQDLEATVAIVEQNPHRFNLPPNELLERKQFIINTRRRLQVRGRMALKAGASTVLTLGLAHVTWRHAGPQDIVADMNSSTTKGKIEKDKREVRSDCMHVDCV